METITQAPSEASILIKRRLFLTALVVAGTETWASAPDEAALRKAMARYAQAWNRRDVAAWNNLVTADLHYNESYLHTDEARQMTTRDRSRRAFESAITGFDFEWQPLRIHFKPDGSATAVMRVVLLALPKTNGKYAATFETNPAIARWRVEDGRWKLYHYVTFAPYAREIVSSEGLLK
jgi:ketosteroid isomerase-like protein